MSKRCIREDVYERKLNVLKRGIIQQSEFLERCGIETPFFKFDFSITINAYSPEKKQVKEWSQEHVILMLHTLLHLYDYCAQLFKRNCETDGNIVSKNKSNTQELISRFYIYRSLKKTLKNDLEIFREMFKQKSEADSSEWPAYYEKMRQWRRYHKKELDKGIPSMPVPDFLPLQWSPRDEIKQMGFHESICKISNCEIFSQHKLYPAYSNMLDDPKSREKTFLFFKQLLFCLSQKIQEAREFHRDYPKILKNEYKKMCILFPQKAKELSFLVNEHKQRLWSPKVELYRLMANKLCEAKDTRKKLKSAEKTYQRIYSDPRNPTNYVFASLQPKMYTLEQDCFFYMFRRPLSWKKKPKIRKFHEIVSLLNEYLLENESKGELKFKALLALFKDGKNFDEKKDIGLELFYNHLLLRGFFDELHDRLDKCVYIEEIKDFRWKKIDIPIKLARNTTLGEYEPRNAFLPSRYTWAKTTSFPTPPKTSKRPRHLKKRKSNCDKS